ncbi:MAG: HEAT repeat domain-containing protein [Acidobacteria bacterium]|nr:HEAT repeat domain-containing protein [Acidobacteriota bacterium]
MATLDTSAIESGGGVNKRSAALARLLEGIVDAVKQVDPDRVEPVMGRLATALGQLSPDMMVSLLTATSGAARSHGGGSRSGGEASGSDIVDHMSDSTVAGFVSRHAASPDSSIERVAQAFQSLVRDSEQRERLLALAHDDAKASPFGSTDGFEEAWDQIAQKMMTTYSDKPFVSDAYARELLSARTQAIEIEQVNDDPRERLDGWLATVATNELRALDLALVLDLLRIEEQTDRWAMLMQPVVSLLEDLLLVGDIDGAETLLGVLVGETKASAMQERRQTALVAIDVLVAGPMLRHIVTHLPTLDDARFKRVECMCLSIGEVLIRPLAEALSSEERTRPRERLTAILIAFGSLGRREVERLKNSPNPTVRRTAVYLLREFSGSEALPELTELLNDSELQVQREAVRAILKIGSDEAFQVLERVLTTGTAESRDAIMQWLGAVRDERAAPLFAHLLGRVDHRGPLSSIYLRAIETLGALKDPAGVPALREALYRGEWWTPRRTALLRAAAGTALARIGTPEAGDVLDEAMRSGSWGVRSAARPHVAALRRATGGGRT